MRITLIFTSSELTDNLVSEFMNHFISWGTKGMLSITKLHFPLPSNEYWPHNHLPLLNPEQKNYLYFCSGFKRRRWLCIHTHTHTHTHRSLKVEERPETVMRQTDWLNNREKTRQRRKDQGPWHTERWSIMDDIARGSDRATEELQRSTGQNDGEGSVGAERKEHVSSRPPQSPDVSGPLSVAVWGSTLAYDTPIQTGAFEYRHRDRLLI